MDPPDQLEYRRVLNPHLSPAAVERWRPMITELSRFKNAELVWCQEEPKNMGGWTFVDPWLELTLDRAEMKVKRARYVGRPASASTAAGLMSRHLKEIESFLEDAFA